MTDVGYNPAPVMDRLKHFSVRGLFGEFNYEIPLNTDSHVTAIIAPNGTGKTACLRLINALFSRRWSYFSDIEFLSASYVFESGASIVVRRENKIAEREDLAGSFGFCFVVSAPGYEDVNWWPGSAETKLSRAFALERYISFLTRRATNQYSHDHTGEIYTVQEAVELFGSMLPPSIRASFYGEEPVVLKVLIQNVDCHLIETQRLLILRDEDDLYRGRSQGRSTLAISKKAQTLKAVIAQQLTAYANLSQSLDRSFPRRVIMAPSWMAASDLKTRLSELDHKRASLMLAGILDSEADDPVTLPAGPMEDAIARVLSVYAQDTLQKLNFLSKLQARIELFIELIQERFNDKVVSVSK